MDVRLVDQNYLEGKKIVKTYIRSYECVLIRLEDDPDGFIPVCRISPSSDYDGTSEINIDTDTELSCYDLRNLGVITAEECEKIVAEQATSNRLREHEQKMQQYEKLKKELGL